MQGLRYDMGRVLKERLFLKIADIGIRVDSDVDFRRFNDFGFYKDFLAGDDIPVHCRLRHAIGNPPDLKSEPGPFCPTGNWQISRSGDKNVLVIGPPPEKGPADNVVVFNSDYSSGEMYQDTVFELFRRFIDQFLMINLLGQRNGFLLHASAVAWEGKGLCFAGRSGVGKSTLLGLFGAEVAHEHLLNDDRLALRKYGDSWRIYGTPWYGESRISSSKSAPLSTIFFLRQSKHNYVRRLSAAEICPQLAVLSLLPLWDGEATSRVLDTFQSLVSTIPAFELGFLPDKSAVELIKEIMTQCPMTK